MKTTIKKIVKSVAPQFVKDAWKRRSEKKAVDEWMKNGCPAPPPHIIKQNTIKEYQQKYGYSTLIETGTFMGDMIEAQKRNFKKVISIELGVDLAEQAKRRFKNDSNVTIVQGDSGKTLPKVLTGINEPAIFWLDGHYSSGITAKGDKDCPIFEELDAIFNSNNHNHIILIDDARLFVDQGDYPSIEKLTAYVQGKNKKYRVEVKNDIIQYLI